MVFTLGALKHFANFTGVALDSLLKKASGPQTCKFIKKRLQHRYFPVKLAKGSDPNINNFAVLLHFRITFNID